MSNKRFSASTSDNTEIDASFWTISGDPLPYRISPPKKKHHLCICCSKIIDEETFEKLEGFCSVECKYMEYEI